MTRDAFSLGGIFHGAVEVFGEEWSFGYCPTGTGVRLAARAPAVFYLTLPPAAHRAPSPPASTLRSAETSRLPLQVYSCAPRSNPNYTYRESLALGVTSVTPGQLRRCVEALQDDWPGGSYDLLSRNCNTFCDALCAALGVGPPPAWVNRFAQQGDELRRMYETGAETLSTATTWLRDRRAAARRGRGGRGRPHKSWWSSLLGA